MSKYEYVLKQTYYSDLRKSISQQAHSNDFSSPLDHTLTNTTRKNNAAYMVMVNDPLDPRFIESART